MGGFCYSLRVIVHTLGHSTLALPDFLRIVSGKLNGMQAFMQGKVKVQGDMSKLMLLQQQPADPAQDEIQAKVKEITE